MTFIGHYLPGYKAGGPVRTIANMVDHLGDELSFMIVTLDHDLGNSVRYSSITPGVWTNVGKASVMYLPRNHISVSSLAKLVRESKADCLYLNSFFSRAFTIAALLARRLGLVPEIPVVLAPRGEFSAGAMVINNAKKRAFIAIAKLLGLYRGVIWQASSSHEENDIRRWFGLDVPVVIAPDLRGRVGDEAPLRRPKVGGELNVVFLSRISPIKNLDGALRILKAVQGRIRFDIYGPMEDPAYWQECQTIIPTLPTNVTVQYMGSIPPDRVISVLSGYDLFFFPTYGENFGHVILEALLAGCPVLLSDQTPWLGLEKEGVGWDIPLGDVGQFQAAIQEVVAMDDETHSNWSRRAFEYGVKCCRDEYVIQQNISLFQARHVDSQSMDSSQSPGKQ